MVQGKTEQEAIKKLRETIQGVVVGKAKRATKFRKVIGGYRVKLDLDPEQLGIDSAGRVTKCTITYGRKVVTLEHIIKTGTIGRGHTVESDTVLSIIRWAVDRGHIITQEEQHHANFPAARPI
jgi:hypothetical protein